MNDVRKKTFSNLIWRFAERCGAQGVSFVVSLVLARLLEPEAYGTIALITVFTTILNVFIDSGLGTALIQKKDADDLDFSSVFYFNIIICIVLYGLMFFAAPYIAMFYEDNSLIPIIRVLSLTLIISGIKNIQQSYVSKTLQFKRFFFSTIGGTIGAAIIGISMAYLGFGVWALVAQQLFNSSIDTIILWCTIKWRPKKIFSFKRLKGLLMFGWNILCSTLINTIYQDVRQLIIGKMYSATNLAFFNRGKQFPYLIVINIDSSVDSVIFPVISEMQENKVAVRNMLRRAIKISTYIMAPLMIGLAVTAETVVEVILTDKWLPCVPFLRIFCVTYIFYPIHSSNLSAVKALGRSDLVLKLEIIKKIMSTLLLVSTMWFGIMAMAYSLLLDSILTQMINAYPNKRLLDYGYTEQLKDILPGIILAIVMGVCILPIEQIKINKLFILIMQIICGGIVFVVGSVITKNDSYMYLRNIIKQYVGKKL